MRRTKWHQNYPIWTLSYWNENSDSCFRFNNPKQCSNGIILVSFCSSHLAIQIATMFILWKLKKSMQKSSFPQKIQKSLCITTKSLSKFQTQLSRKLQRFRTCRKNKKCSIFHDLSEYIIFHMVVNYWTGPLTNQLINTKSFFFVLIFGSSSCSGTGTVSQFLKDSLDSGSRTET